jgi:hypothetical protein
MALVHIDAITTRCPFCGLTNRTKFTTNEWVSAGFAWVVKCENDYPADFSDSSLAGTPCNNGYVGTIEKFRTIAKAWKTGVDFDPIFEEDSLVILDPYPSEPEVVNGGTLSTDPEPEQPTTNEGTLG